MCSVTSVESLGHSVVSPRLGVNSAIKSTKAWAFIAVQGQKSKLYWPSSNGHFITR